MTAAISLAIGYLLGCLNPAALLAAIKRTDLRQEGSGNLGATNTMMVMGWSYGIAVLVFDMAKAFLAVRLAQWLFPGLHHAGILAGAGAVLGHVFPFYMGFRGGKGLASYGGMFLALAPSIFLAVLGIGIALMLLVNYAVVMPVCAAILGPILYARRGGDGVSVAILSALGLLLIAKNFSIVQKTLRGEDHRIRQFLLASLLHRDTDTAEEQDADMADNTTRAN